MDAVAVVGGCMPESIKIVNSLVQPINRRIIKF